MLRVDEEKRHYRWEEAGGGVTCVTYGSRPMLKWAGGKSWQVPFVEALWGRHHDGSRATRRRLVEPFAGGAAITFALAPERSLLADSNRHLIDFYARVQKSGPRGLAGVAMEHVESTYYRNRERFNALASKSLRGWRCGQSAERAALFYYLNRSGFNGLCRFNSSGLFNVPFGRYKTVNYSTIGPFHQTHLMKSDLHICDFEDVPLKPDDFVYADPPYDDAFAQFTSNGFSWEDQVRCANWLAKHPGPVVAANLATPRIVKLYRSLGFKMRHLMAPRRISSAGGRTAERELFATRNV